MTGVTLIIETSASFVIFVIFEISTLIDDYRQELWVTGNNVAYRLRRRIFTRDFARRDFARRHEITKEAFEP